MKDLELFNPSICIARKIQKSNRIINNIFRNHLKHLDLSNSQVSILFVLSKKRTISQKDLSEFLALEKSTVNRNIKRLVTQGYLEIISHKKVSITDAGLAMVLKTIPFWEEAMSEIETILKKEGLDSLNLILNKLTT